MTRAITPRIKIITSMIIWGTMGINWIALFQAMKHTTISNAILSYLDPIVAILMSFLFLGESMNLVQALGALLILSTAYISEKSAPL